MKKLAVLAMLVAGCSGYALPVPDPVDTGASNLRLCPATDSFTCHFPTGETVSTVCLTAPLDDGPSVAAVDRALSLVWDGNIGDVAYERPTFEWVPSCNEDVFMRTSTNHFVIAWRGSLACSAGFVKALYQADMVEHWGRSPEEAAATESSLGSRIEEIQRGILIANSL